MVKKFLLSVLCLVLSTPSFSQSYVTIYSQDFESTSEFGLPPGWSQINFTDPQGSSYAAGETADLANSLELAGWTVLNTDQLLSLGADHLSIPDVVHGKSVFAYSDYRRGIQIDYLYTPVFDFRNQMAIRLSFDSNYTQNQDNLAFSEYTLQGNLDNSDPNKKWLPLFYWSNSSEVNAIAGDVQSYFSNNGLNDDGRYPYSNYVGAELSLIDPAIHIEGRYDDNQTSSKKRETYVLPNAAGEQYVQIRFFYGGVESWYWGIDDFLVEGTTQGQIEIPTPTPTPEGSGTATFTVSLPNLPAGAKSLQMALIPAGKFTMGSPDSEKDRSEDEGPQHEVTISKDFYLGKFEITQAQWTAVMGAAPESSVDGNGNNYPVYNVGWDETLSFLTKLNQLGQGTFRLPTEAEWEYACRSGVAKRFYWGDDLDYTQINDYAWYGAQDPQGTHEVGLKKANFWGLFDMSGNVWELCQDSYGSYTSDPQIDPVYSTPDQYPVVRGGSWLWYPQLARSAKRAQPTGGYRDVGFRIALSQANLVNITSTPTKVQPTLPPSGLYYSNDFEGADLSGWSSNSITTSPNEKRKFLGEFDNQTITLTLDNLPAHRSAVVSFDLLILKSWDGQGTNGPDIWDFTVDGKTTLLHTTFDNITFDTGKTQNFPDNYPDGSYPAHTGAIEFDTLGYTFYGDATYHLEYAIPHTDGTLQLAFTGSGLQGISDESWGLDNVQVKLSGSGVIPSEPTATPTPTPEPILYSAEITEVSVQTAPAGTPVELKGRAFWLDRNGLAANVPVKIRIQLRGVSRFLSATTDASGSFSVLFQPLSDEAGKYSVNALHPRLIDVDDIPQKEFILVGMRMDPRQAQFNLIPYQKVNASFTVYNLGDTPLTGVAAKVIDAPANLRFEINTPSDLPSEGNGEAALTLTAIDNSTRNAVIQLQVTSAEGASVTVPIDISVAPGTPQLTANPGSLETGMLRGAKTLVECEIINTGGAVAKNVQVLIPQASWLALVTSPRLGDLAPSESSKITLALTPSSTQKLGLLRGSIVVYGEQVDVTIPFQFNVISNAVGDLKVLVEDEFTYYAAGSPRVSGATVTLKNNVGSIVSEVSSNNEGIALIPAVKEGDYYLQVWAEKHNTYNNTIHVDPGKVNEVRALLPRDLVTYRWKVVPTLIQDRYEFTVESVFETNVPVPVVTVDPPVFNLDDIEGDTYQLDLTVTNHGLIQAEDINLEIGTHPMFEMSLFTNHLDKLAANSSVTVPIIFKRINKAAKVRTQAEVESPDPCTRTFCLTRYGYQCGDDHILRQVPMTIYYFNVNVCGCQGPACGIPSSAVTGGSVPGASSYTGPGVPGVVQEDFVLGNGVPCNPCLMALGEATIDCFLEKIILNALGVTDIGKCGWKTLKGTYKTYSTCSEQGLGWKCLKELSKAGGDIAAACGKAAGKTVGKPILLLWDIVKCGDKLYTAYDKKCKDLAAKIFTRMKNAGYSVSPASSYSSLDAAMKQFEKDLNDLKSLRDALVEFFGDPIWLQIIPEESDILAAWLELFDTTVQETSEEGETISAGEKATLLAAPLPSTITRENAAAFIDRWNRSIQYWKSGVFEVSDVPSGQDANFIVKSRLLAAWEAIERAAADNEASGNEEFFSAIKKSYQNLQQKYEKAMSDEEEGVCARVRIRIEQEAVMTRSAFLATLELDNNSETSLLENVNVSITIRDSNGDIQNERFGIKDPVLTGIASMNGKGSVQPGATARADWTLIPANDAAPDGPTQYFVGGQLSYRMEGNDVTVPLFPDSITVMPDPRLVVKYYHQKDVYSDDPFTDEVEPAEPFSLGLMMTNIGKGTARNMQITSSQPQIVDNEKGLLIDFSIIGTQVGDQEITPSLKINLGDIEPGKSAAALWLMISTLQGKFVDYQATYEHIDGMNNPKLSLIDSVEIHELIHVVRVDQPQDDRLPDFLVNDAPDDDNLPDTIHNSAGGLLPVQVVREAQATGTPRSDMVEMKVKANMPQGWVYLRIDDPSANQHTLQQVLREDGSEVRLGDNAWTTHRVKRPKGQAAFNEDYFHLVDYLAAGKETTYTLIFQSGKITAATPTPTPEPFLTPVPTPEFETPTPTTNIPGATPTPTRPSGEEPTPISTPIDVTPWQPLAIYEFDRETLEEDRWAEIPGGFQSASPGITIPIEFNPDFFAYSADRKGLAVSVNSNEVTFLAAREAVRTQGAPVLIRAAFRSDSSGAQVVLGALKGDVFTAQNLDGSIACSLYMSSGSFQEREKQVTVVYQPDSGEIITPFIQIAGGGGAPVNVLIDRLDIIPLKANTAFPGELFGESR